MPTVLVPAAEIPELAKTVSPEMIDVLRRVRRFDSILNTRDLDPELARNLKELTDRGLVDARTLGVDSGPIVMWVSNGNGIGVLNYATGIRGGPHYELQPVDLAAWLDRQGSDLWWNIDGDRRLGGRMYFPCPTAKLSEQLRSISGTLLVQAKKDDVGANGQTIGEERIDECLGRFGKNPASPFYEDRILYLCWKGALPEWLLIEDNRTARWMKGMAEIESDAALSEANGS